MTRGILYLATGALHVAMARASIESLRESGYHGPVRILTDTPGEFRGCDAVEIPGGGGLYGNRRYKTRFLRHSDFDVTLALDADTRIAAPIDEIWQESDAAPFSLALRPDRQRWNSGVILFSRTPATEELFDTWHRLWLEGSRQLDEPALHAALFRTGLPVHELPSRFNWFPTFHAAVSQPVIIHDAQRPKFCIQ